MLPDSTGAIDTIALVQVVSVEFVAGLWKLRERRGTSARTSTELLFEWGRRSWHAQITQMTIMLPVMSV
jgi:hypothetical protein